MRDLTGLEELTIPACDLPDMTWNKMTHLRKLSCYFTSELSTKQLILSPPPNLTSITLTWNIDTLFDFSFLLVLVTLVELCIECRHGPHIRFKSIFRLPKLSILSCKLKNLTPRESKMLKNWQEKQPV